MFIVCPFDQRYRLSNQRPSVIRGSIANARALRADDNHACEKVTLACRARASRNARRHDAARIRRRRFGRAGACAVSTNSHEASSARRRTRDRTPSLLHVATRKFVEAREKPEREQRVKILGPDDLPRLLQTTRLDAHNSQTKHATFSNHANLRARRLAVDACRKRGPRLIVNNRYSHFVGWNAADAVAQLSARLEQGGGVVTYAHCETMYLVATDPQASRCFTQFDTIYIDGVGAQLALLALTGRWLARTTADVYIRPLLQRCVVEQWPVAFIGSSSGNTARAAKCFERKGIHLAPLTLDGFSDVANFDQLVKTLRGHQSRLVVLGMGQPLQEQLALKLRHAMPAATILCLGGFFDVVQEEAYAPHILRRLGLEWTMRLIREPRAVGPRYLMHPWVTCAWILRSIWSNR